MGYWQPNRGWQTSRNQPVAGEYRAIALDLHGISASQAEQLKNDMESTQQKINTEDCTNLGKQQLVGDLLYATILSYFALNNVQDSISARQANMVTYKAPSYGIFKTNITPMYWFGIPRNVKINGLTMDVDRITHLLAHKDNDHEQWVNYNRASGARLSAMEHLVPEQMFSTDENPAHGISAVKAIQLAAAEGQKIWTITQANLAVALANITLDNDIKNDIRNAVNAGQEVTTHDKYINFHGKNAAGYIILNPTTGAGAYMISSGENGGDINVPDLVSNVTGYASILIDIGLYAAGEASNIAGQASRFIMSAFSKLLSGASTALGWLSTAYSAISNCPIEVAALIIMTVTFLTILSILLIAFVSFLGGILVGLISSIIISTFSERILRMCKE